MGKLLIRLAGPMQSWGIQSRFTERDTGTEPSKSGVVGLLCAAQGLDRIQSDEFLARFNQANVRMGVPVDREGIVRYDFHTAGKDGHSRADGTIERKNGIVSRRYYLADALFLVGLQSDDLALLEYLQAALHNPVWSLYLGRKAFVLGEPVWLKDGLKAGMSLEDALTNYPYLGRPTKQERLRMVIEDPENGAVVRPDQPLSFAERRFAPRKLTSTFVPTPAPLAEAT